MEIPTDKDPIKIIYIYEDGLEYYVDGIDAENFNKNIDDTAVMAIRGHQFRTVSWKKTTN